ncbi:MAG: DUF2939 domain-containing protein [Brevundimonas sp.]|nr:MAG: DUF2939 domain-containing protein [Brevundimonas sp.]
MKKLLFNLIITIAVIAVVAFFAAPAVGFFAIRSAADASDVAGLSRLIDFAAVRQSLRPQLDGRPEALAPPPSFIEDPIGAFRRRVEDALPAPQAPDVDAYLTPSAISALTRGEGRYASQRHSGAQATRDPFPAPVFWGVNRARMAVEDDGGSRTIFTFERRGPYEWKLVHIGLPEGAGPAAPARVAAPAAAANRTAARP